jgi:hypothetical protein
MAGDVVALFVTLPVTVSGSSAVIVPPNGLGSDSRSVPVLPSMLTVPPQLSREKRLSPAPPVREP